MFGEVVESIFFCLRTWSCYYEVFSDAVAVLADAGIFHFKNRIFKLSTEITHGKFRENQDAEILKTNKTYPVSQLPSFLFWDWGPTIWRIGNRRFVGNPKRGAMTSLGLSQEKTLSLIVGERLLKCGGSDTDTLFLDYTLIDEQDDSRYIDELL